VKSATSDVDLLTALVHIHSDPDNSTAVTSFGFVIILRTNHHEHGKEFDRTS
jgi:hypothetical protein